MKLISNTIAIFIGLAEALVEPETTANNYKESLNEFAMNKYLGCKADDDNDS